MIWLLAGIAAAAGGYQLLAAAGALRHVFTRERRAAWTPPVSVLKPLRGLDPHFADAIRSHVLQDYPELEVLFGVSDPADPAAAEVQRLAAESPGLSIRLVHSTTPAINGKVGVLAALAAQARYPILVISDSDIRVSPDYLRRVIAPLEDQCNGVVTCLYRARAEGLPALLEAVGIETDFAPSVLVARLVGVSEFGLGSTLALRAGDLERIGGFASVSEYLADDYQLSRRISELGLRVVVSPAVVETSLPPGGWREMWRHQVRWARTIRVSRGGGYAGLPLTNATLWAGALAAAGYGRPALALFGVRLLAAVLTSALVLGQRSFARLLLIPARDLFGMAVWAAGLFGSTVVWRGCRLRLARDGRISELAQPAPAALDADLRS